MHQASTSGPSLPLSNAPSTSGTSGHGGASPSTPTTASVPPTLKRPRESAVAPDSDSQSSLEERAGPSGNQKKARTISSTEFLQVSSGGAEVVEMGGVSGSGEDSQPGQPESAGGAERQVESSSNLCMELVGTSGEMAASSVGSVATSSQEEPSVGLDSEHEDGEDEGDLSEELEEEAVQELAEGENLDDMSDDEAGAGAVELAGEVGEDEEIEVDQPEGAVEDNSSEPSSSTGTR